MKYEIMKRKLTEEEQVIYDETAELGEWLYERTKDGTTVKELLEKDPKLFDSFIPAKKLKNSTHQTKKS
ncbi:MAG: hypothetical protein IEMM0008_0771 [bacterium]|nr:MAG: hypothetical protein IEMM0008_0771 [bacterium]